jgi:hypothetical protein
MGRQDDLHLLHGGSFKAVRPEVCMGSFEVTCCTSVPVGSYHEPDDFVVTYTGEVLYRDEDDQVSTAGQYTLYRVLGGLAADHGQDLFDVCDAHSQELHEAYAAVFDPGTGDFRDEVGRKFDCVDADLVVIDSLTLDPKWRGLRLGLLVLRRLIDLHLAGCGLVVCRPYPLEGAGTPEQVRRGTLKLRRYIRQLGFRRIGKTPYYGLSTSQVTPKIEDLLHQKTD